jgi:hypothetical protein
MVYTLSSTSKNPLLDSKVKATIDKIRKLEDQISMVESEGAGKAPKKKATRKKTAKKKASARKTTRKSAPGT